MQVPAALLPHIITVRPYTATSPYGDVLGDPVTLRAFVEDRRRLVVAVSGEEVISETTAYAGPDLAVPIGSTVTVWPGTPQERTARVITATRYDHPSAWSHLEIALT